MQTYARAFPIKSREALENMGRELDSKFTSADKAFLAKEFGLDSELWFYQEIDGKPYVIAVARGESLDDGYKLWGSTDDPFAKWFREQVLELSGYDLTQAPRGPEAELVYELHS